MLPIAKLGPSERADALDRLDSEDFDVLVIGGGVTGAGSALDAASRGLRTALIEREDFAAGTSSASTKLIHGGLRYLEKLDFGLVQEALTERARMLEELCPHLVHPVPFLYPLTGRAWERAYVGAGVLLYDTIGTGKRGVPVHKHLSRTGALRLAPDLREDALVGAIRYYDAQVDDARHTAMLARTAAHHGALVTTHVEATDLTKQGGCVTGAVATDTESGREVRITARRIVNATGPWTDEVQNMAGQAQVKVRPSKGVHFLVPRERLDLGVGLIMRTEKSVLFVVPWGNRWIIGTTDTDWDESVDDVVATQADLDYLLDRLNPMLRHPLTKADITGVYAGLRPLLAATEGSTAELSREHSVLESTPGLISIGGGKYTTYRVMAEDAVDRAVEGLDREVPPSPTRHLPLLGAIGYEAAVADRERIARQAGVHVAWIDHLLARYGDLYEEVLALGEERPHLMQPLEGAPSYLGVEVAYAASHEGARDLFDALERRTRVRIEVADRGLAAAEPAAAILADVLDWDDETRKDAIDAYRKAVEADRAAEQASTDQEAVAARHPG
ncbi:glycerol-3-phosphate dehydrogenase/oxidase [Egibacter rhizosphaerae]|uniref:Glycerol-3-phosphate dehydrogenase n=1 Tax=Egibacter rhizosphaerae TaxID=1670831 RepID=A0A411YHG1_9ACTN|nr:glycerol-3-phosphate dehydrogenase/oxidase [Egibacter rhizosphaerae]QBI20663.1 glycerol-3-phosphate dehydrogenase/oxidase [Egibacter rhizosphaerae]